MKRMAMSILALAFCAATASAGTITYTLTDLSNSTNNVGPTPVVSNAINIGTITGDAVLHVFDDATAGSGVPNNTTFTSLLISGTVGGRLIVHIADQEAPSPIVSGSILAPTTQYDRGLLHMAGGPAR